MNGPREFQNFSWALGQRPSSKIPTSGTLEYQRSSFCKRAAAATVSCVVWRMGGDAHLHDQNPDRRCLGCDPPPLPLWSRRYRRAQAPPPVGSLHKFSWIGSWQSWKSESSWVLKNVTFDAIGMWLSNCRMLLLMQLECGVGTWYLSDCRFVFILLQALKCYDMDWSGILQCLLQICLWGSWVAWIKFRLIICPAPRLKLMCFFFFLRITETNVEELVTLC